MSNLIIHKGLNYKILLWILLVIGVIILLLLTPILSTPQFLPADDYVRVWASGRLNLQGKNPYDVQLTSQLQNALGIQSIEDNTISILLTPPWTFLITMPFSIVAYPISRLGWLIFSISIILVSSLLLWDIYSENPKLKWLAMVIAFLFAPTISVLEKGQLTPLLLLGLSGFLFFITKNKNDWLAGACLALVSIKPQLILLFWLVLFLWVIQKRRWIILISLSLTIILFSLAAMVFNPHIIQQYMDMLSTYQLSDWANPTIGAYLRFFWFGIDNFWLQFLPTGIGAIGIFYYWYFHKQSWNWSSVLPLLLFASIITSPYMWTYDQVLLIPAIIQAFVWISGIWKHWTSLLVGVFFVFINILDLVLHTRYVDFWFIWLAPALLLWYFIVHWCYSTLFGKQITINLLRKQNV